MKVTRFTKWFIYIINNCDFSVSASYRKFWLEDLKGILSELVSENQAAYIPGRHITDNVVLAYEAFHAESTKEMLNKFTRRSKQMFVNLMMACNGSLLKRFDVKRASLNGSPYGNFTGSRGIRQGDPLFILCADVLSSLIHQAKVDRIITPLRLSIGGPAISHLLFAMIHSFFSKQI